MTGYSRKTFFSLLPLIYGVSTLLLPIVLIGALDLSRLADAYLLGCLVIFLLFDTTLPSRWNSFSLSDLPDDREKDGKDFSAPWLRANILLGTAGAVLALVSVLIFVFAPQAAFAMTFLARGEEAQSARELLGFFLRLAAPQLLLIGLGAVLHEILSSFGELSVSHAARLTRNAILIAVLGLFWNERLGNAGLALGTVFATAATPLLQLARLRRLGMPIRPRIAFRAPLSLPWKELGIPLAVMATAVFLAAAFRANLLFTVPAGITMFGISLAATALPYALLTARIDPEGKGGALGARLRRVAFVLLPLAAALSVLALPLIRALFERGRFSDSDSLITASFFRWYALTILPVSLASVAAQAFHARRDYRTPAIAHGAGAVLNMPLGYLLLGTMGAPGVALASLISSTLASGAMLFLLWKRTGFPESRADFQAAARAASATLGMALILLAGLWITAPSATPLESGTRFPAPVARRSLLSDYFIIREKSAWQRFWSALHSSVPAPPVDFSRQCVLACIGPQTATTTTLTLADAEETSSGSHRLRVRVNMPLNRKEIARSLPRDAPTSPSFLLLAVHPAVSDVRVDFEFKELKSPPSRFTGLLRIPDLTRLLFLGALGAVSFVLLFGLLRAERIAALTDALTNRIRRKRPREPLS